jgi:large subunit ribosomal protein L23
MGLFSKKKTEDKKEEKKEEKKEQQTAIQPAAFLNNENILTIKAPRVTEKSQNLKMLRQYVFDVNKNANKIEVKKAIEKIYNVKVEKVRMINVPAKKRRAGLTIGRKPGYKKAIVTLKEGHQIEVIPQK